MAEARRFFRLSRVRTKFSHAFARNAGLACQDPPWSRKDALTCVEQCPRTPPFGDISKLFRGPSAPYTLHRLEREGPGEECAATCARRRCVWNFKHRLPDLVLIVESPVDGVLLLVLALCWRTCAGHAVLNLVLCWRTSTVFAMFLGAILAVNCFCPLVLLAACSCCLTHNEGRARCVLWHGPMFLILGPVLSYVCSENGWISSSQGWHSTSQAYAIALAA